MIGAIQTALSGLAAATKQIGASANNIANLSTAGSLDGDPAPYSTVQAVQQTALNGQGVSTVIVPKSPGFVPAYDPDSPFANADGMIGVPATDLAEEAVNMTMAKTAYKANAAVIRTAAEMEDDLLKMVDRTA